jgi:hypothetical protein
MVLQELVQTEEKFVTNMQQFLEVFVDPLQVQVKEKAIVLDDPRPLELFERLKPVRTGSGSWLEQLKNYGRDSDPAFLFQAFEDFGQMIPVFFHYIYSFTRVSSLLRAQRNANKAFDAFCSDKESHGLNDSMQSFLIQPIQRPPRYRLLFQELLKALPPGNQMHDTVDQVLRELCEAMAQVDERMEQYDELVEKSQLDSKILDFDVFMETRRLFFNGLVMKFSRKTIDERLLVVFSDLLLVAEPALSKGTYKVNKIYTSGEYNLVAVVDCAPFANAVDIRQQTKSFRVNMPKKEDKKAILDAFEKVKQANGISQDDLDNRGFAPVWIPDDLAPNCMSCGGKFTFVNRRHHCRACGDCVCGKCFKSKVVCPGLGPQEHQVCPRCFRNITKEKSPNHSDG